MQALYQLSNIPGPEHFYCKVGKEQGLTDRQGLFPDWLPAALETVPFFSTMA